MASSPIGAFLRRPPMRKRPLTLKAFSLCSLLDFLDEISPAKHRLWTYLTISISAHCIYSAAVGEGFLVEKITSCFER